MDRCCSVQTRSTWTIWPLRLRSCLLEAARRASWMSFGRRRVIRTSFVSMTPSIHHLDTSRYWCHNGVMENEQKTKICSKCGEQLPVTTEFFYTSRGRLNGHCKKCHRKICAAWESRNREKRNADARAWTAKNIGKERERWRKQREADPQKRRDAVMRSYYRHQEQRQEYRRRYRQEHLEEERARDREAQRKNPERRREMVQRRRALKKATETEKVDYKEILKRDGYVCHICGWFVDPADVAFDHVIPLAKGGTHTKNNIAVAHYSCNLKKNARIIPSVAPPPFEKNG